MRDIQKLGTVTILNGAAVSDAIVIPSGYGLVMVGIPTSWTAADLGFKFTMDGGTTFVDLFTGVGTTVSRLRVTGIPTASASLVVVPGILEIGFGVSIKVTSIDVASNADANQTGDIAIDIWIGRVDN